MRLGELAPFGTVRATVVEPATEDGRLQLELRRPPTSCRPTPTPPWSTRGSSPITAAHRASRSTAPSTWPASSAGPAAEARWTAVERRRGERRDGRWSWCSCGVAGDRLGGRPLVAQRTAVARVVAAARGRSTPAGVARVDRERARSLDDALDDLEATVSGVGRRARRRDRSRAEDRLSWALGAIAHGVVVFDERGEVVYRNDPAATFLAARHSEALVEEAIRRARGRRLRGRRRPRGSSSCSARPGAS